MLDQDYVKITYQSDPIGKEKIILYLTTFDMEKYEQDHQIRTEALVKEIPVDNIHDLEESLNDFVRNFYIPYVKRLKDLIDYKATCIENHFDYGNVANSGHVECDTIKGNVVNCDNVYCNKIEGNVVNCDVKIMK